MLYGGWLRQGLLGGRGGGGRGGGVVKVEGVGETDVENNKHVWFTC